MTLKKGGTSPKKGTQSEISFYAGGTCNFVSPGKPFVKRTLNQQGLIVWCGGEAGHNQIEDLYGGTIRGFRSSAG